MYEDTKITDERTMYAYKVAYILGMPSKKIATKFPVDIAYSKAEKWKDDERVSYVRRVCNTRNLILKNLDEFKALNDGSRVNSTFVANMKTLSIIDDEMGISHLMELYKKHKCNGVINYFSLWLKNNLPQYLSEMDIPFPREVTNTLFVYPGFQSEEQLRCFCDLRVQSAVQQNNIIIPRGFLNKTQYENMFDSDKTLYSTINTLSPDVKIDLDEIYENNKNLHWNNDTRYIMYFTEDENEILSMGISNQDNVETETSLPTISDTSNIVYKSDTSNIAYNVDSVDIIDKTQDHHVSTTIKMNEFVGIKNSLQIKLSTGLITPKLTSFLEYKKEVVVAVDCDNVDFFKVLFFVKDIISNGHVNCTVQLYIDPKSTQLWNIFENFFKRDQVKVIRKEVARVKDEKSSVDIALATDICKKIYRDSCRRIIILSSDCDYIALLDLMTEQEGLKFAIGFEDSKINNNYKKNLKDRGMILVQMDDYLHYNMDSNKDELINICTKYMLGYSLSVCGITGWSYYIFTKELSTILERYNLNITESKLKELIDRMVTKIFVRHEVGSNRLTLAVDDFDFINY